MNLRSKRIEISQETKYPWEGSVKIGLNPSKKMEFTLCVRIPGWSLGKPVPSDLYRYLDEGGGNITVKLNGKKIPLNLEKGYLYLKWKWEKGDQIEVVFPMKIRRVLAHENVLENRGKVAIERGPVVFCAKGIDSEGNAIRLELPDYSELKCFFKRDLLGCVSVIEGDGFLLDEKGKEIEKQKITLIPYFSWANRGGNEVSVWLFRKK